MMGREIARIEEMIRRVVTESGVSGVVLGISGGIDSAVSATLCMRALGPKRVLGLMMPSAVTSERDIVDAGLLCEELGLECRIVGIEPMIHTFEEMPDFTKTPYLVGNLMARIRMAVLYYHANREHLLVCGTSNKSEYMLGYCTKFGDSAADLQPILHLYKTDIFRIAGDLEIPSSIIGKIPSAGLWAGQTDEEELGISYRDIDATLQHLEKNGWVAGTVTEEYVRDKVAAAGHKRNPAVSLLSPDQTYP
jgi:NAD+ synthase